MQSEAKHRYWTVAVSCAQCCETRGIVLYLLKGFRYAAAGLMSETMKRDCYFFMKMTHDSVV